MTTWQLAIKEVDLMDFEKVRGAGHGLGEFHVVGRFTHNLITKECNLPDINGFECIAKSNYCPDCKTTRNQTITILSGNRAYTRYFMKHGQQVNSSQDLPIYDDWAKDF